MNITAARAQPLDSTTVEYVIVSLAWNGSVPLVEQEAEIQRVFFEAGYRVLASNDVEQVVSSFADGKLEDNGRDEPRRILIWDCRILPPLELLQRLHANNAFDYRRDRPQILFVDHDGSNRHVRYDVEKLDKPHVDYRQLPLDLEEVAKLIRWWWVQH